MKATRILVALGLLIAVTKALPFHETEIRKDFIDGPDEPDKTDENENKSAENKIETEDDNETEETKKRYNYRLPTNIIPFHYDLKLVPHIQEGNFTFDGEVSIDIQVLNETSDVMLNAKHLKIDEEHTTLTPETGDSKKPEKHTYEKKTEIMTITFDNPLQPGKYILKLKFVGDLNEDLGGFYRSHYHDDNNQTVWLATTHFEPTGARQAFPCWDEPALKATFDISIKHYDNYTALSNMPELKRSPAEEDGKIWTHFQTTPPISTYLIAFVVSDFANISNEDGSIRVWCKRNAIDKAQFIFEVAQEVSKELEKYTNSTTRIPKMDHIAIPQFPAGAMENWGLITYSEYSFFYEADTMKSVTKQRVAVVAAHELAHQWFGNVVSPAWWSYVWLNEGFAAYFENYILDKVMTDWDLMGYFTVHDLQKVFMYDNDEYSQSINEAVETPDDAESKFTTISYDKAASVLRMLSHIISDKVFQTGLRNYINKYAYKATVPDNLWEALQNALDESEIPHDDFNVKEVMDTWIVQSGYPLVKVKRDYDTGRAIITQEVYHDESMDVGHLEEDNNRKWWIPINYATKSNPDFSNTLPTIWLRPQDESITIENVDSDDWIIVNIQQTGYYRVSYDTQNWKKIAEYLNSDKFTNIHPVNRAQILNDAYYVMKRGLLSNATYFEILNYMSRESDYVPWHPGFRIFRNLAQYLNSPSAKYLKEYIATLLESAIESTGFIENPNDDHSTKLKRTHVFRWACLVGNSKCLDTAEETLSKHLDDPVNNKVSPNLENLVNCYGMRKANETTWNKMLDLYLLKKDGDILSSLGCVSNRNVIRLYLTMLFMKDSPIKENHISIAIISLIRNPAAIDEVFDFIVENWNDVQTNEALTEEMIYFYVEGIYNMEQINKLKRFLKVIEVDDYDEMIKSKQKRIKASESYLRRLKKLIKKK